MEMTYKRKRFTNKLECGIWSFDRRGPKGAPRIFARCSRCGKVNDLTGGVFVAEFENGKCRSAKSGCQSCRFCGRAFNEWVFERWVSTLAFIVDRNYSIDNKSPAEIVKAITAFKGKCYAYLASNTVGIGIKGGRAGQTAYYSGSGWMTSVSNVSGNKIYRDFNEAMTAIIDYLEGNPFVVPPPAAVPAPVAVRGV